MSAPASCDFIKPCHGDAEVPSCNSTETSLHSLLCSSVTRALSIHNTPLILLNRKWIPLPTRTCQSIFMETTPNANRSHLTTPTCRRFQELIKGTQHPSTSKHLGTDQGPGSWWTTVHLVNSPQRSRDLTSLVHSGHLQEDTA